MGFRTVSTLLLSILMLQVMGSRCGSSNNPDPDEGCTVYQHSDFEGTKKRGAVPYLTGTYAIDDWANTSLRWQASDLQEFNLHDRISSAKIVAEDSAVSLYLFRDDDFDNDGRVFHCPKGQTCWINNVGWINDKTSSLICQREFIDQHDGTSASATIIDLDPLETIVADLASSLMDQNISNVKIDWIPRTERCEVFEDTCNDEVTRYTDFLKLTLRFEANTPFPVRDRDVRVRIYFKPKLENGTLTYRGKGWTVWVEGGLIGSVTEQILNFVMDEVENVYPSLPGLLTAYMPLIASPPILNGRDRLQMHVPSNTNFADWVDEDLTPTIVLNQFRF